MKETLVLPLETLAQLEKAAPRVILPSHEAHLAIVKALGSYASQHKPQIDSNGTPYWRAALAEVLILVNLPELAPISAGKICRNFRLVMKRENDGFKVAWSEVQLTILKKAFDLA